MSGQSTAPSGRTVPLLAHLPPDRLGPAIARVRETLAVVEAVPACLWARRCRGLAAWPDGLGVVDPERLLWLHFGPVGPELTTLAIHGWAYDGRPPDQVHVVPTLDEHRRHPGALVSYLALTERPAFPCREFVVAGRRRPRTVWVVAADASSYESNISVEWQSDGTGSGTFRQVLPERLAGTAAAIEESVALMNLLRGQGASRGRRGRRSRWEDRAWREHAERALALKRDHPELSERTIAARLHVDERTLRNWKAWYRAEAALGPGDAPTLLLGGSDPDGPTTP